MKPPVDRDLQRRHRLVGLWAAAVVVAMVGASYAAVPLYSLLCQLTNFDGTPRRALTPSTQISDKTVSVRFDANVAPGFPWRFEPDQRTVTARLGENMLVFYRATNTSDHTVTGTATYNVFPEQAAAFFNKVQCFCFTEQTLQPGQTAEFPVSFFVDPAITDDKDARDTTHITLSYTFYPVPPKASPDKAAGLAPGVAPGVPGAGPSVAPATPSTVPQDGRRG